MALNYDFAKKKEDNTEKGAPSAAEEPKQVDRPEKTTDEERDTYWIDEAMVAKQGLDMEPVNQMFAKIHEYVDSMEKKAADFKVIDEPTMTRAIEMGTQAKQFINKIEKKRKEVKAPYLAFTKRLDTLAKGITSRLEDIQEGLRTKIRPVMQEQRAKEEAARKAALKAQEEAAKKKSPDDTGKQTQPPPAAPPAPAASKKTATGSAKLQKTFEWDVTDIKSVPEEYLTVAPSKINTFIKANLKLDKEIKIPGIEITYSEDVAMRAAKS
jgi:hypothetical protein